MPCFHRQEAARDGDVHHIYTTLHALGVNLPGSLRRDRAHFEHGLSRLYAGEYSGASKIGIHHGGIVGQTRHDDVSVANQFLKSFGCDRSRGCQFCGFVRIQVIYNHLILAFEQTPNQAASHGSHANESKTYSV